MAKQKGVFVPMSHLKSDGKEFKRIAKDVKDIGKTLKELQGRDTKTKGKK